MSIADELVQRALSLPVAERAAIVHQLLASLDDESTDTEELDSFEAAWQTELENRLAAVDAGDIYPGTWSDLLSEIRQAVAAQRKA